MVKLQDPAALARILNELVINTPCPMDWERMEGDDRKRFCSRCEKHVYDLSQISQLEALQLIGDGNPNVCARVFRRPDGTIVTSQCLAVGKKAIGRRFQFSIATLVAFLTSSAALFASAPWIGKQIEPFVERWFPNPQPTQVMIGEVVMPTPANTPVTPGNVPPIQCDAISEEA